jgi:two-component system response regulator FixJ
MKPLIIIIDDEAAVRDSLTSVLSTYGYRTKPFSSAREALASMEGLNPDCVVLDVRMPDMDGLAALRVIRSSAEPPPIIMITGHADVPMAVQAMKLGASDFIEKPVVDEELAQSIKMTLERRKTDGNDSALHKAIRERHATLTERENAVASLVVEGYSSTAIAATLNISVRTVDHHRAAILAKMQATSLPQLLRFLLMVPRRRDQQV